MGVGGGWAKGEGGNQNVLVGSCLLVNEAHRLFAFADQNVQRLGQAIVAVDGPVGIGQMPIAVRYALAELLGRKADFVVAKTAVWKAVGVDVCRTAQHRMSVL